MPAAQRTPTACAPSWIARRRSGVVAVVTIADDVEAARGVVRAADWDPRVYAAVAE
jgi:hypothetical protein